MKKIGVFGGSFDPPHMGHRRLVKAALNALIWDEIWVIPVGQPVHRELTGNVSEVQRLLWVETMFADMPNVRVLDWEVRQNQPVAAIETMQKVSAMLHTVPWWLMGMDAWQGLPDWQGYPAHRELCNIAVFDRQDECLKQHDDWKQVKHGSELSAGHVWYIAADIPNISATRIREMILAGKDVATVLDARIADDIKAAYKTKGGSEERK